MATTYQSIPVGSAHEDRLTLWSSVLQNALFLAYAVAILNQAAFIWRRFPDAYEISELLIKYTGGYVRRGLLGSFLYQLPPDAIRWAALIIPLSAAILLCVFAWRLLGRAFDPNTRLTLFFSPFILGFFLYFPCEAFRKDGLCLALLMSVYASAIACEHGQISRFSAVALGLGAFMLAALIHEQSIFFAVLPLCFLVSVCDAERPMLRSPVFYAIALAGIGLLGISAVFAGTAGVRDAMTADWISKFLGTGYTFSVPSVDMFGTNFSSSAISFIGQPFAGWFHQALEALKDPIVIPQILVLFGLALLPILILWRRNGLMDSVARLHGRKAGWLVLSTAATAVMAVLAIQIDYGRVVFMTAFSLLAYTAAILSLEGRKAEPVSQFVPKSVVGFLVALVWFFGVTMKNCVILNNAAYRTDTLLAFNTAWFCTGVGAACLVALYECARRHK